MVTRPATIRETHAAWGQAASPWNLLLSRAFAILLLPLGSSLAARAQTPPSVSGTSTALAVNANNEPEQTANALLNTDSSVVLVEDGALTGGGCQPFTTDLVNTGAAFYDSSTSTIYVAMIYNAKLYAGYETLTSTPGQCTQEPLLELTADPNEYLEMNADPAAGYVYIVNSSGVLEDTLYVLPTAPWVSTPTPLTQTLDYSAEYGPIVIDPSSHYVYINDLGDNTTEAPGTQQTNGFFVYNPSANQIEWVTGYIPAGSPSGTAATPFYISTLLNNGSGELILINENPTSSSAENPYLTTPITVLNTTASGFNLFSSTESAGGGKVDLTPPAGALTTIDASTQYSTISAADLDAAANLVYAFAFDEESGTNPTPPTTGLLLEYNLAPSSSQPTEVLLSSSVPMPLLNNQAGMPWGQLNFNPATSQAVLSANNIESGALAVTSPLCSGSSTTPTVTVLYGSSSAYTPLDFPVINTASGYVYAVQPEIYGTEPPTLDYVAPPSSTCSAPPTYTVGGNVSGLSSGASVTLLDNGGGSLTVNANAPFTFATALASGSAYSVTVATQPAGENCSVTNGSGTVASADVTDVAVACVSGTPLEISPAALKAGIVGTNYTEGLTASGGSGSGYTWTVLSGSALSAAGLTLESDNGEIFGVPSAVETAAPFTVQVMDSLGDTAAMTYNLTIYPILGIGPSSLSTATVGVAYSQAFTATGGSGAGYTWTLLAGGSQITALGLSLSTSGVLSGTPNAAGSVSFGIQVTDSAGDTAVGGYTLTVNSASAGSITISDPESITVNDSDTQVSAFNAGIPETVTETDIAQVAVAPQLTITTSSPLPQATLYTPYSVTLDASGGSGSGYTWQALDGGSGLTYVGLALSSAGVISGTPSATEAAITLTILVSDSLGNSAIKTFVLTVGNPVPAITNTSPAYAAAGSGAFQLVVFGSGFLPSSTINWNGTALSTTLTGSLVSAEVPASDIASSAVATVTVVTPAPGGGSSNAWQFEVSPSGSGTGTPPVITPVSVSVSPGSSAKYSISLPAGATKISLECLNLPSGASCSFTNPTLTITTSTSTPAGTYTIVAVFTYTVPGAASSSLIFLPLLLLPLVLARRRWARARIVLIACVGLAILTLTNIGCGGGATHQATSTAGVTLVVQ